MPGKKKDPSKEHPGWGGKRTPAPGKKLGPAKKEIKYQRRMITLSPEVAAQFDKLGGNKSKLVDDLLRGYFETMDSL